MSRIAQKLCDEIVEPAFKPSGESNTKSRTKYNNQCFSKLPSQASSKRDRSVIEKKVTKIYPSNHNTSKSKIQEPLVEKIFNSKATNTDITGPLRCDTECLTLVQNRKKCSCKCIKKVMSNKMVQKLNNLNILQSDKACTHTVKTITCGTQFSDKLIETSNNLKSSENRRSFAECRSSPQSAFYDFMGARRWALSQFRIHGPDF